ncbi:MAG: hypothetical protein FWH04_09045 [Oscillospiraceae bacterium]|nr:hypothetical protein [Oscillospiraceae bacterium]
MKRKITSFVLALAILAAFLPSRILPISAQDDLPKSFEQELSELRGKFAESANSGAMDLETIILEDDGLEHIPPEYSKPEQSLPEKMMQFSEDTDDAEYVMPSPPGGVGSTRLFQQGQATLIGQGEHTNIWVLESTGFTLANAGTQATKAATEFDAIYKRMSNGFAEHDGVVIITGDSYMPTVGDIDGDGRINVLFHDDMAVGGGFFRRTDFEVSSNRLDMFHVNVSQFNTVIATPSEENWLNLYSTMAHEFQHLLFFMYAGIYGISPAWFNEGLSELAGTLYIRENAEVFTAITATELRIGVQNTYEGSGYRDFFHFNGHKSYMMSTAI